MSAPAVPVPVVDAPTVDWNSVWSMNNTLLLVNLVLLLFAIGFTTYAIIRIHKLWHNYDTDIAEIKTVIGRLVREINTLNAKKYIVDSAQTDQLKQLAQQTTSG
jgi:hypothetical protein